MNKIAYILLIGFSLYTAASQGQENPGTTSSDLEYKINPYHLSLFGNKKGYLEKTRIAVGTILKSHHFNKKSQYYYNESNNGAYININQWSTGVYTNTAYERSVFMTYNPNLYRNESLMINLIAGVANGYDGLKYAQGDYLPILGASVQWGYVKTFLSYDVAAFGIELPLN